MGASRRLRSGTPRSYVAAALCECCLADKPADIQKLMLSHMSYLVVEMAKTMIDCSLLALSVAFNFQGCGGL